MRPLGIFFKSMKKKKQSLRDLQNLSSKETESSTSPSVQSNLDENLSQLK